MKTTSTFILALVISAIFSVTAAAQPSLGTTAALEGPAAGSGSVVLAMANPTDTWTATANDAWLHLSVANQSGTGSTNVVFSYDANPGTTRTGSLTIAGQTLTVTQAGSTYVAAPVPLIKVVSSGLFRPSGVALDTVGNVYIADSSHNAIKEWVVASNTVITLVRSGLGSPGAVAVDGAGNVYIADTYNNAIKEWVVAHNTVTTLVSSGLSYPWDVALDALGNVYIADDGNHAIEKWTAASNTVTTLIGSGLGQPLGVALDSAGNFYIADFASGTIQKWVVASQALTTLVSGLYQPYKVAVDGAGNVYIADTGNNVIKKWTAASQTVTTLVASGLSNPMDVEVDALGNVYIADKNNNAIKELPRAFVDPTAKAEGPSAGSDTLPVVLPATANLLAPFAPTNDQPWLTITGITNGVVSFTFGANTTATNRTAHLTLLGQPITITQAAATVPIISQPANLSVCAGSPATFSVTASGDNAIYQWQVSQDGGNTFTNISATATNPSYTNLSSALADNGNQYQVIVSGWLGTATSAPPAVLTVNAPATAGTGGNQTIQGTNCLSLNGAVGGCVTGGVWTSSGSGTFLPNATTLNAMYCPSTVDLGSGTVMLTLTSTGPCAPCTSATAQMAVTLQTPPTISNGPSNLIVCAGSPAVFSVSATGGGLSYQWQVSQDGGNTFTNISDTATNASYPNLAATLADNGNQYQVIVTGTVFSATSAPPAVLTVSAPATASAGANQTIGAGSSTAPLGGSIGGGQTTGLWTSSGTGTFTPDTTALNAIYTPSVGDTAAGSVTLTLTSSGSGAPCPNATAQVVVTIEAPPAVGSAPTNLTVCAGSPAVFSVGATGGGLTYQWQVSQDGGMTFTNISGTATNASYTNMAPTVADNGNRYQAIVSAGGVSVTSAPPAVLTVYASATASAGGNQTICAGNSTLGLGGAVGGAATGGAWSSSGTGGFVPDATTLSAAYSPSAADIAAGTVTLTLNATGQLTPCPATAQVAVTIHVLPAIGTQPTNLTVCAGSPAVFSVGAAGTGLTYQWQVSQDNGITFTNLSDRATDASYTKASATLADNGNEYQVIVSGTCAPPATSSPPVVLTVLPWYGTSLGTTALLEGPGAGSDSVILVMAAPTNTWTAAANAAWLHLNASGAGSMNVVFSYDANPGGTRAGTLTIGGLPLTVTQAGSTYVPAPGPVTTLVAAGLIGPYGVAVDGVGNVYFADTYNNAIKEWMVANNTVTTLVASGLNQPTGVAVDGAGNVYFANVSGFIDEWMVANNTVSELTGIGYCPTPLGVAVDGAGNVYFGAEWGMGGVSEFFGLGEWTAASQEDTVPLPGTYLEAPENPPGGVAVDAAGNVYFADAAGALNEWNAWNATNTAYTALFSSLFTPLVGGLSNPWGVAVDGGGNVYIADTGHQAIKEWMAANNTVTTLVSSGLGSPKGIAVDRAGNVYFADWGRGTINELPHAFVDPTAKSEGPAAGSDGLPVVLPATANLLAPFAPTSDSAWLTISGITNGVVSFAFGANSASTNRTAHITLLGQSIAITQAAGPPSTLIGSPLLSKGTFQFAITNNDPGASFTVLTSTNPSLPLSNWTVVGPATNTAPGVFQFSTGTTNNPQGFYRVRSP